MASELIVHKPK